MSTETVIVATEKPENGLVDSALAEVTMQERLFALAQRKAQVYAQSSLVPKDYQGNIGNVLIAENMARRLGADTLMVMQNLYVVHGKPGWSAVFLISCFNTCGRFSAIKYRFQGERKSDEWGCQAFCTELATGEEIAGTWVTWAMANAEGWVNKTGSKWKSMPEQMFRYRAATFLIRATAPEIGMGLLTKDELDDIAPQNGGNGNSVAGVEGVKSRLKELEEAAQGTSDVVGLSEVIDVDEPETTESDPEKKSKKADDSEPFDLGQ